MRVERHELFHVRIPFRGAFAHASHERHASDALIVCLHGDDGTIGWGEIQPRRYVTGESVEDVWSTIADRTAALFIDEHFSSLDDVRDFVLAHVDKQDRQLATFGGFEMALLDLVGCATNTSAGEVLGPPIVDGLPAGVIIGFEVATEALAKHCALLRFKRRRHIKVKVGQPDDAERLRIISSKLNLPLRLDANEAWTADEAIERLASFTGSDIASVEQPVAAADLDGLRRIREAGHRVMVDESLVSYPDAEAIVAGGAADVFNIRLGKHGGLVNAKRIVDLAKAHGIGIHLGTMVGETSVLTRATEIFATRVDGFDCLDGKGQNLHLSSDDIVASPAVPFETPPSAPGLGVRVALEKLERYGVVHERPRH